jgi:hypothetical protein
MLPQRPAKRSSHAAPARRGALWGIHSQNAPPKVAMKSASLFEAAASLLDDYAAALPGFVLLNPTASKLPHLRDERVGPR